MEVYLTPSLLQPTDSAPPNAFAGLLHSRKFLLMLLDVVASTILYFASQSAGANLDNIKFLIAAYQPVIIFVINSITVEDTARTKANADVQVAAHQASADIAVAQVTAPQVGAAMKDWPPRSALRPIEPR